VRAREKAGDTTGGGRGVNSYRYAPDNVASYGMRPERMRMWQAAEQLMAEVDRLVPRVKPHAANAADHLERSAESVLFNIGEGAGAYKPKAKINAYEIAKKEANEVRAILRRLVIKRVLTKRDIRKAYDLAGAIIGMLTGAIVKHEKRSD
jgi:four helix bundle protein